MKARTIGGRQGLSSWRTPIATPGLTANPKFDTKTFFPKFIFQNPGYKHAITDEKTGAVKNCSVSGTIDGKCPGCDVNLALEPHPCPYASDILGFDDDSCVCCQSCIEKCGRDV